MASSLTVEVAQRIATLTLNRPQARNSLDKTLIEHLVAALVELDQDDEVDVMILTGTDPVFCAGLDLKQLEPGGELDISALTRQGNPWPERTKPLIGAVNGPAVTGGLELALYCDILVASERARFGDTHARVGILPFWAMTVRLPEAVGARTALAMSLTGNFLDAAAAERLGMVTRVVAHDQLLAAARELATDIVSNDQAAVCTLLAGYRATSLTTRAESILDEQRRALAWQGERFDAEEFARRREAVAARGRRQAGS